VSLWSSVAVVKCHCGQCDCGQCVTVVSVTVVSVTVVGVTVVSVTALSVTVVNVTEVTECLHAVSRYGEHRRRGRRACRLDDRRQPRLHLVMGLPTETVRLSQGTLPLCLSTVN